MLRALLRLWQRSMCPDPVPGPVPRAVPITFPIAVYSHRGGWLEQDESGTGSHFVENTMPAFRHSAKLGVDLLELDVQLTKDKHVVVVHDRDLGRLCGRAFKGKSVKDFNYEDLPPLLDKKASGAAVEDKDRRRIPNLEELFQEFPKFPIQIDFKANSEELVHRTHELIMRYPQRHQLVIWGSFIHNINSCAYKLDSSIPLSSSMFRMLLLLMANRCGIMDEFEIYESFFIAPWEWLVNKIGKLLAFQSWIEAVGSMEGVAIVLFGGESINNVRAYEVCKSTICHAICTDTPSLLQTFLADTGPLPPVQVPSKQALSGSNTQASLSTETPMSPSSPLSSDNDATHKGGLKQAQP